MELHKALRQIIKTEGSDIIADLRLVNILDDLKVFSDQKHLKNILRILIQDNKTVLGSSKKTWNENLDRQILKVSDEYGWSTETVAFVFKCITYGLSYTTKVPTLENTSGSSAANANSQTPTNKKKSAGRHLKFRNIDITGDPKPFTEKLVKMGYEVNNWWDDYVFLEGPFAGVPNCKLCVYFDPKENTVYAVTVDFPSYQSQKRVIKDYKKLKKALQDLYGKPVCDDENFSYSFYATYTIKTGIIKLRFYHNKCCIEYYDGYYDNHHGEIIDSVAKLDL